MNNVKPEKYHIYGRMRYEQPLAFVQEFEARKSVATEALTILGTEGWVELVAIPVEKIIPVIGEREDG